MSDQELKYWAAMAPKAKRINHILSGKGKPDMPASMYGSHNNQDPTVWVEVLIVSKSEFEALKDENEELNRNCISRSLHESRMDNLEKELEKHSAENEKLKLAMIESKGCWDAAYFEGFSEAMNQARDGDADRLLDLLDRRLLYALTPIEEALRGADEK